MGGREWYAVQMAETGRKATTDQSLNIEHHWKGFHYKNATGTNSADEFLQKIDWSKVNLTPYERLKAESRLKMLLNYLQKPEMTSYLKLMTNGLHYEFTLNTNSLPVLRIKPMRR